MLGVEEVQTGLGNYTPDIVVVAVAEALDLQVVLEHKLKGRTVPMALHHDNHSGCSSSTTSQMDNFEVVEGVPEAGTELADLVYTQLACRPYFSRFLACCLILVL